MVDGWLVGWLVVGWLVGWWLVGCVGWLVGGWLLVLVGWLVGGWLVVWWLIIIIIIINIYIAQISCEYDQMRVTKKYAKKLTSENPNWQEADQLAIYKAWWSWWLVGWLVVG